MRANRGELFIGALAFCLVLVLGLSVAVTPTWAGEAERYKRYLSEGLVYDMKDQHDLAIASYKRAIRLKPDNFEVHYLLGFAYRDKGQYDAAIASFRQAVRLNPDNADMHFQLGLTYDEKGQWDAAITSFKEVIRLRPRAWTTHYELGFTYAKKGDRERALAEYEWLKTLESGGSGLPEKLLKEIKKISARREPAVSSVGEAERYLNERRRLLQ